jgi:hypothetical protein
MATRGFRDIRPDDVLKNVPDAPKKKTFLNSLPGSGLIAGAGFKLSSLARKAGNAFGVASKAAGIVGTFKSLGAILDEYETKRRHPRLPDEPTTSRLARGVIANTVAQEKRRNLAKFVKVGVGTPKSFGRFLSLSSLITSALYNPVLGKLFSERGSAQSWSEPPTPYAAKYPYNQVQETEAGHVVEIDDTPGAERLHAYHRAGTFIEVHPNGTTVQKIVKDRYTVVMSDDHLKVSGNCHVSIEGNCTVFVKGNLDAQVDGAVALNAKGRIKAFADNIELNAKHKIKLDAPLIDLKYMTLPSSFRVAMGPPASSSFGGGPIVAFKPLVVPTTSLVKAAASGVVNVAGLLPTINTPPTLPLTNPKLYKGTDVASVVKRARQFDSPDDLSDIKNYQAHIEVCRDLKDFDIDAKNLPGVFDTLDTTLSVTEPAVTLKDFSAWEGVFAHSITTALSTFYTLGDLCPAANTTAVVSANASAGLVSQLGLLEDQIAYNLQLLAVNCLDPIKAQYPSMVVTEGFRESNSGTSQHETGEAADIQFPNFSAAEYVNAAKWIRDNVAYDHLILNFTNIGDKQPWIHISFSTSARRREVYTKDFTDQFHEGIMAVTDYTSDVARSIALTEAKTEIAAITADNERLAARYSRLIPVDANAAGTTGSEAGGELGSGSIGNFVPMWSGVGNQVIGTMEDLITQHPDEWERCAFHEDGEDFLRLLVLALRAQGLDCALNGKRGNASDLSQDVIAFPNPSGCRDTSGTKEGLELYDVVAGQGGDNPQPAFGDATVATLIGGASGCWVEP